jgi:hypothetical protein
MIPKGQRAACRAWAAYEWATGGRKQRYIGRDLGFPDASATSAVCTLIAEFLAGIHPELLQPRTYPGRHPNFGIYHIGRQELIRQHFGDCAPPRPDWVRERPTSFWFPGNRKALQRVRDPDERWAARDVWLSWSAGPGFDWMEAVTWT